MISFASDQSPHRSVTGLLLCPFCGHVDLLCMRIEKETGLVAYFIQCQPCGSIGPALECERKARAAWNSRAKES